MLVSISALLASAAPIEKKSPSKWSQDHNSKSGQNVLTRPSPINPNIPSDPKPEERIILIDSKEERDLFKRNNAYTNKQAYASNHRIGDTQLSYKSVNAGNKRKSRRIAREVNEEVNEKTTELSSVDDVSASEPIAELPIDGVIQEIEVDKKEFETSHRIPENHIQKIRNNKFETSHHPPEHIKPAQDEYESARPNRTDGLPPADETHNEGHRHKKAIIYAV